MASNEEGRQTRSGKSFSDKEIPDSSRKGKGGPRKKDHDLSTRSQTSTYGDLKIGKRLCKKSRYTRPDTWPSDTSPLVIPFLVNPSLAPSSGKFFLFFFLKLDHFLRTFCKKCIFTIENPKKKLRK